MFLSLHVASPSCCHPVVLPLLRMSASVMQPASHQIRIVPAQVERLDNAGALIEGGDFYWAEPPKPKVCRSHLALPSAIDGLR